MSPLFILLNSISLDRLLLVNSATAGTNHNVLTVRYNPDLAQMRARAAALVTIPSQGTQPDLEISYSSGNLPLASEMGRLQ
ncbi:MAG: hypothetical protein IPH22_13840 [Nitrosomonas sp.]|nr:hypothetical protein [Nitrosomonas sp.]